MTQPEQPNDDETSDQLVLYIDKIAGLATAFGTGCLISNYLGMGTTTGWIIVAVGLGIQILLHVL